MKTLVVLLIVGLIGLFAVLIVTAQPPIDLPPDILTANPNGVVIPTFGLPGLPLPLPELQTAYPNGMLTPTAGPPPVLIASGTPNVALFIIPDLEPDTSGTIPVYMIPPIQDMVVILSRIIHVLQAGL